MQINASAGALREQLLRRWRVPGPRGHEAALRGAVALLATTAGGAFGPAVSRLRASEQPFDAQLLLLSPLYRRARRRFFECGGSLAPVMISSPRSLSSPSLLESRVEYTPAESEYVWAATDRGERRDRTRLLNVRSHVTTLFHEQNHRTLWSVLPPAPTNPREARRYLNFAESVVIATDMALGDELGPRLSSLFYLTGTTYDPGTTVRSELRSRRAYRNYLQAAMLSTYLNLELLEPDDIATAMEALFPSLGPFARRAATRAANLDRAFVWRTNPTWQRRHVLNVIQALSRGGDPGLRLSGDPVDNRQQYLLFERWMDLVGL